MRKIQLTNEKFPHLNEQESFITSRKCEKLYFHIFHWLKEFSCHVIIPYQQKSNWYVSIANGFLRSDKYDYDDKDERVFACTKASFVFIQASLSHFITDLQMLLVSM